MNLTTLAFVFLGLLFLGYHFYGSWLARQFQLNDQTPTPAHTKKDDIDFVPTSKYYLFGQHFSAIAAAGPIAGPIVACQLFGWMPSLLWILIGVILIGAVHDFTSLTASVRHEACSIAEMTRKRVGGRAGTAMLIFIIIALIYIIVAFTDITASSFVSGTEELEGIKTPFNAGGAVAAASVFYLLLSMIMGLLQRYFNPPLWSLTLVFVPLTFACSYAGTFFSTLFIFDFKVWALLILIYCALGSISPVWLLLQPRGYLGGYILYSSLLLGLFGILFGGYEIIQPPFQTSETSPNTPSLFPFLFVTIACGACSGFHGIVCSGTTSKQVDKESDIQSVGYGAMLAEAFVAFIALSVVMIMSKEKLLGLKPGTIYGNGMGEYLTLLIGKEHLSFAITFGAMAFSTFVFDTLDVSTRLGRYLLKELFHLSDRTGILIGTLLMSGTPAVILLSAAEGGWIKFWTLFGASNQLLAALTLFSITLWLWKMRKPFWYTLIPMVFVSLVTLWALGEIVIQNIQIMTSVFSFSFLNAITALTLIVLAVFIFAQVFFIEKPKSGK